VAAATADLRGRAPTPPHARPTRWAAPISTLSARAFLPGVDGVNIARVLRCDECGCASDELGRSWVAFAGEDPDGLEPTSVAIMCPVCAAREFEWRPEAAAGYV